MRDTALSGGTIGPVRAQGGGLKKARNGPGCDVPGFGELAEADIRQQRAIGFGDAGGEGLEVGALHHLGIDGGQRIKAREQRPEEDAGPLRGLECPPRKRSVAFVPHACMVVHGEAAISW